jgi:hypothetical protein
MSLLIEDEKKILDLHMAQQIISGRLMKASTPERQRWVAFSNLRPWILTLRGGVPIG